jgi:hypothetical protein
MRLLGHVARVGEMKNLSEIIIKHAGKRAFEKPCHRWEFIIKIILHK